LLVGYARPGLGVGERKRAMTYALFIPPPGAMPHRYRLLPPPDNPRKVAKYVGVSGKTLDKATAVVEAAERKPEK
jgi:hypothetical protein